MTNDPEIHDGMLDLAMWFDIGPDQSRCLQESFGHDYYFQDQYDDKWLQMVISDRVPNCFLEAMQRHGWLKFELSTDFLRRHLGSSSIRLNTEFF